MNRFVSTIDNAVETGYKLTLASPQSGPRYFLIDRAYAGPSLLHQLRMDS
jgi:hypothetical protein